MTKAIVFLYVMMMDGGDYKLWMRTPMPDWDTCWKSLAAVKQVPVNAAGDNETAQVVFCGGKYLEIKGHADMGSPDD